MGRKVGSAKALKRPLAKKQVQNSRESDGHGAVGLHQPSKHPGHELLPKWRQALLRLTQEALNEVTKEKGSFTPQSSPRPSGEAHSPGAAEAQSS